MNEKGNDETSEVWYAPDRPDVDGTAWTEVPLDPDASEDLGYEWGKLDIVPAADDEKKAVVLPADDEMLRDEAFLVCSMSHVTDVVTER